MTKSKEIPDIFDLKGKTALVTGSSRGIGRSIAITLAGHGADIVVNYAKQKDQAEEVCRDIKEMGVTAVICRSDLTDLSHAKKIYDDSIKAFGKIDILVLNASLQIKKSWDEFTVKEIEEHINANFLFSYELIKFAVKGMEKRNWGRILTIGSIQEMKPLPDMLAYAASKCAQTSLVRSIASQVAGSGITVNNLAPGTILTERNRDVLNNSDYYKKALSGIPAGYFGEPSDCTGLALLLCSEAGRYISGESIFVDGGAHL